MKKRLIYYFNRLTGFRYASLEKKATWEIRKKNWRNAAALISLMENKESYKYCQRVVGSAEAEERFKGEYSSAAETLKRIRVVFPGASVLDSVPVAGGIASIGLFRHELLLADGGRLKVFEKVYLESLGLLVVRSQDRLFHHIPSKVLSAPDFYGYIAAAPFVSAYQAFIPSDSAGTRLRRLFRHGNEFDSERLVQHLWAVSPPPELLSEVQELESSRCRYIELLLAPGPFIEKAGLSQDAVDSLAAAATALPRCVMHGDLNNPANVIIGKDRSTYVLDWDSWLIAPVGWGLLLSPRDFRNARIDRGIRSFCESREACGYHHARSMIALYNLTRSMHKKNSRLSREWRSVLESGCEPAPGVQH